ncbi:MAG TPA: CHC2 zinc finger domain-containing protein [Thermoanaerobaculia bacterium]|nr:CHC2 zinc finger domain-containing protein [Thermoanaerobaculia bacterium]
MARILEEEIERIKREVSLERLVTARGIELRRHGADLIGLCPFHDDHEPSLVITPAKNLWHCLGACQTGGSVIDWVMKCQGVSFRHAVEILRADFLSLAADSAIVKQSTVRTLGAPVSVAMSDAELMLHVVGYYHETLRQSPEALAFLKKRGLDSAEMIDHFKLGFANRTLGLRLPNKQRKEGAEIRSRLERLGILRESTGHEHFNGSLVVPVFDGEGHVAEMYGRKITTGLKPGTPLHLYLPGPHRGVWNEEALAASKEIILCEALIDAMTFWCAGYRNVTASYGIEGFTADHLTALQRNGTEHVLIAYDRDDAGDRAAASLAQKLIAAGIRCSRIHFPKGMDANEYALKVQPASRSLGVVIRSAEWIGGVGPGSESETAVFPLAADSHSSEPLKKDEQLKEKSSDTPLQPRKASSVDPESSTTDSSQIVVRFGDRRYRVRGMQKNTAFDSLRINVLVSRDAPVESFFVDTVELYSARQRSLFEKQAAAEIGVTEEIVHRDVGELLRKLEELQQDEIRKALAPKDAAPSLTDGETKEALDLLRDPDLPGRILRDFARCGVVGEETNKLMGYLAAVSRKLDAPLAIIIQSSSAAGKSALMEAVLAFMPEEERVQYSAMTGQSLFYMGETNLKHKILAIAEEEGAERASYALKLLQSEGRLTIASTGKDPATGKLVTHEYHVEGPVMIFLTTTAIEIDEELLNRCIVLTVDEDREQTRAIHRLQRESQTLEGLLARRDSNRILTVHRNAQRLLRPLLVANPFARELTFMDSRTRTRRDHMKYLTLIRAIALLHQYQRERKTIVHNGEAVEYIEVTTGDIALANKLAHEVLGRSLDEFPPQTRRLLGLIDNMVTTECERQQIDRCDYRFSRRQLRAFTGWGETQLRIHLERLTQLEYLLVHRGGRGQSFVYELLYEAKGELLMSIFPAAQAITTIGTSRGEEPNLAGGSRGQNGGVAGGRGPTSRGRKVRPGAARLTLAAKTPENAHLEDTPKPRRSPGRSGNGRDHDAPLGSK